MRVKIALIAVYSLLTLTLVVLKGLKVGNRGRGVIKMATAAMFVATGIYGCVIAGEPINIVMAVGLLFAAMGDLFLVFMDNHKWFIAGVLSFAAASTVLSVYAVLKFGWTFWSLIPFVLFTVANIVCQVKKIYSYGRDNVYLNIYTVCVTVCGSLGLAIACSLGNIQAVLFGVGCFMYQCSDICLGLYLLKFRHRALDIVNSLLYFPGMLLIAMSLIM